MASAEHSLDGENDARNSAPAERPIGIDEKSVWTTGSCLKPAMALAVHPTDLPARTSSSTKADVKHRAEMCPGLPHSGYRSTDSTLPPTSTGVPPTTTRRA